MRNLFFSLGAIILVIVFLIEAQFILKPLALGGMIAVAINPIITWLMHKLRAHWLAFLLFALGVTLILSGLVYVVSGQLINLFEDLNTDQFTPESIKNSLVEYLKGFGLTYSGINEYLGKGASALVENGGALITTTLAAGGSFLLTTMLTILFTYLFSAYYPDLKKYSLQIFEKEERKKLGAILQKVPIVIIGYLEGISIVMLIMGTIMTVFYFIIGLQYALVWGLLTGILVFIPYIGSLIAIILPLAYSLITSESMSEPTSIIIFYIVVQQIEGNILTPKILGNKVDLNPLISIILLLVSAQIWGVLGVFLSIPLGGLIKIVLEEWDATEPYALLMSEEVSDRGENL